MTFEILEPSALEDGGAACAAYAPALPTLTLRALLDGVASAVRAGAPREAWVDAAVVGVRRRSGGYALELGENDGSHSAAGAHCEVYLPERNLATIRQKLAISDFDPADLEKSSIIARLTLSFHPRFHLQGIVQDINPAIGDSLLAKHLDRIRARLRSDGLLDAQSRLRTPPDICRLAVIHPAGAAGWADVAAELGRLQAVGVLEVAQITAAFEGPAAVDSVLAALQKARNLPSLDIIMLVRGGGASSGLAVLANEELARAICASPVPIVTGIGHASDRGLLDEVAWRAADTPSKALRLVMDLIARPAELARKNWSEIVHRCHDAIGVRRQNIGGSLSAAAASSLRRIMESSALLDQALANLRIRLAATSADLGHQASELERLRAELIVEARKAWSFRPRRLNWPSARGRRQAQANLDLLSAGLRRSAEVSGATAALLEAQAIALATLAESFFAHIARGSSTQRRRRSPISSGRSIRSASATRSHAALPWRCRIAQARWSRQRPRLAANLAFSCASPTEWWRSVPKSPLSRHAERSKNEPQLQYGDSRSVPAERIACLRGRLRRKLPETQEIVERLKRGGPGDIDGLVGNFRAGVAAYEACRHRLDAVRAEIDSEIARLAPAAAADFA